MDRHDKGYWHEYHQRPEVKRRDEAYRKRLDVKERAKQRNMILKREVLQHYSPTLTCCKCGFSDIRSLTIDHIKGRGIAHRREIGSGAIYWWLKANDYPHGFQVLCMNCQFIKRYENHECGRPADASDTADMPIVFPIASWRGSLTGSTNTAYETVFVPRAPG